MLRAEDIPHVSDKAPAQRTAEVCTVLYWRLQRRVAINPDRAWK